MPRWTTGGALTLLLAAMPLAAQAQWGYAATITPLHAGPGAQYPIALELPPGSQLFIHGCLGNYQWCDVESGPYRGWAYAGSLVVASGGNPLPVLGYGPSLGIGILGVPFYGDRDIHRDRRGPPERYEGPPPRFVPDQRPPPPRPNFAPPPDERPRFPPTPRDGHRDRDNYRDNDRGGDGGRGPR
ncbi:MAG: hypothetical protein PHI55_05965 [Burkholderiaceae bacterium]|nr:hypothetical protein [Burkholderiaceae bacterium]